MVTANNRVKATGMTDEQVRNSVKNITGPIVEKKLPQMRLKNKGIRIKVTKEEIALSCSSLYKS